MPNKHLCELFLTCSQVWETRDGGYVMLHARGYCPHCPMKYWVVVVRSSKQYECKVRLVLGIPVCAHIS
jgi:hypothetical protein